LSNKSLQNTKSNNVHVSPNNLHAERLDITDVKEQWLTKKEMLE